MTAPQLPAGWGAPSAPAAPPAQTAYASPQQFQQPQYAPQAYAPPVQQPYPPAQPQFPGYPDPNYQQYQQMPAPMGQQYAPQPGYGAPQQPPAAPPPQHGTLADYANQPESGASFWKFKNPGDTHTGVVSRDLVDTDTVERTFRGQVQKRFDGSPDWVLRIPMTNADGTDGVWEVGGKDRTALKNALIAAGKADGIPAKGWAIRATFTHFQTQANGQGLPSRIKQVEVMPPNGQAPQPAIPNTVSQEAQAQAAQQYAPQQPAPQAAPQPQQYAPQQPVPAQQFAAPPAPAAQPQAQPAPGPAYQQQAPQPQQFQAPQGGQFAGMPADAAAQFQNMLGGAQPTAAPQG